MKSCGGVYSVLYVHALYVFIAAERKSGVVKASNGAFYRGGTGLVGSAGVSNATRRPQRMYTRPYIVLLGPERARGGRSSELGPLCAC